MKQIIFKNLDIINFKGIEKLSIQFDNRTSLRGANGTGKTTVADALCWVLFNKDSNGNSPEKALIKRRDGEGNEIHNQVIDVSLTLMLNNVTHIFRRKQEEIWNKVRGIENPTFTNEGSRFYNELSLSKIEYDKAVSNILSEDLFKVLTNPMYFMSLDKKQRREQLIRLVGKEDDIEKILRSKSSYFLLDQVWSQNINMNKSFSQLFDYVRQEEKANNTEIEQIPNTIKELEFTINTSLDETSIKSLIKAYSKELNDLTVPVSNQPDQRIKESENQLRSWQQEYNSLTDKANKELSDKRSEIIMARQNINFTIGSTESKVILLKNQIESNQMSLDRKKSQRLDLLSEYKVKDSEEWIEPVINAQCPTCGQDLPNTDLSKLISDHRLNWEQVKNRKLDSIVEQGKEIAQQITVIQQDINIDTSKISEFHTKLDQEQMKLSALPSQDSLTVNQFIDSAQLKTLTAQIQSLQNEINNYYESQSSNGMSDSYSQRKSELQAMINDNNQRLGALNAQKETLKRIDKLLSELSIKQSNKNRFKTLIYLCETFEMDKNKTIENVLNSHFGRIKWKLYNQLQNGGYESVCDPLLDGKPYDAQSTGERIFTGCDIINTFQGVYETEAPVLIDNRESLTLEVPLSSQAISMYADERYNVLTQQ